MYFTPAAHREKGKKAKSRADMGHHTTVTVTFRVGYADPVLCVFLTFMV